MSIPQTAKDEHDKITKEQVNELAKALLFMLPPHKRVYQTLIEVRKTGIKPHEQARILTQLANDYLTFGT
jgi:hypothetical protein